MNFIISASNFQFQVHSIQSTHWKRPCGLWPLCGVWRFVIHPIKTLLFPKSHPSEVTTIVFCYLYQVDSTNVPCNRAYMVPMVMTESGQNRIKSHRNISLKEWLTLPYAYTTGIFFQLLNSHIILFEVDFNLWLQELMITMIQMWVVNSDKKKSLFLLQLWIVVTEWTDQIFVPHPPHAYHDSNENPEAQMKVSTEMPWP